MTPKERARYFSFLAFRSIVAIFDLVGILAIGFLVTSIALFITLGSDAGRIIEFGGASIPAVTAQTLPIVAALILSLFIVKAVLSILLTRMLALFLAHIEARAARTVADRSFGSGLMEARIHSIENVYFAVQAGSPAAFNSVLNSAGTIAAEGLLFILVISSFFAIDPVSAIGALVYFALIAAVIQIFIGNLMQKAAARAAEGAVEANTAIGDLSEALREATISGKKGFFFEKIYDARIRTARSFASQLTLSQMPRYIVETALMIAVAVFVLWQSASGDIVKSAGTIGIFLSGGLRLTASLLPLQSALLSIKQSIPMAEKALQFLVPTSKNETRQVVTTTQPASSSEAVSVSFEDVSFKYPGGLENTIRNITLAIKPGQQVAFIGPSGAGKSTVADLLLGLLTPTEGRVLVGGQEPTRVVLEEPGRLAYVPQRPGMISGTVSDNVALGEVRDQVDPVRLKTAIDASHLNQVLANLPEGVNTSLGKRKDELSGGQLQRIGLARALYSVPSLLVMDEATSALDADSENEINKALDEMRGKVTVILIAHRLNTVQRSDVVFLVEEGRVTASGTFPELLRSNKTVQTLAKFMSISSGDHSRD
jgi:ABC-type multidrug transport system fused ATPase/permease subunit